MIVKLRIEHHLEFLSLKGGCRGSSESTLVKMSNCWKSHAAAQMLNGSDVMANSAPSDQGYTICSGLSVCRVVNATITQEMKKDVTYTVQCLYIEDLTRVLMFY